MPRFLGIDYGTKRIGIALSDEALSIAYPQGVVQNNKNALKYIAGIADKYKIEKIIVGLPRGLSSMQETAMTKNVREFADKLEQYGFNVDFEDEFLTTVQAKRGTVNNKKLDASSAALILQSYLSRKSMIK